MQEQLMFSPQSPLRVILSGRNALHTGTVAHLPVQAFYKRKVSEGKNKMSALNAVRNKIIQRVFACVRDGRKYENIYTRHLA